MTESEKLEQAAKEYAKNHPLPPANIGENEWIITDFKAGAEWKEKEMQPVIEDYKNQIGGLSEQLKDALDHIHILNNEIKDARRDSKHW